MKTVVVLASLALLLTASMLPAGASPGDHHGEEFGAVPGDPRIWKDGAKCFEAANESGDVTCAVLYGHIFRLLNRVPINVQHPPDWYGEVNGGFSMSPGFETLNLSPNEMVMASTPGFVEYKEPGEIPRIHPEVGITADVAVPNDVPILGYWYMSADVDEVYGADDWPPGAGEGPDVGVMPCLTVRMILETGVYPGLGDRLAVGQTTRTLVNAKAAGEGQADPLLADAPCPGDVSGDVVYPEEVTEFEVVLEPVGDEVLIPRAKGYHVHVEWFQFAPNGPEPEDKFTQSQWNVRTGEDHLARVVLPVQVPIRIDRATAAHFDGKMYVQAEVNSPWGSYDFDPNLVTVEVLDAAGNALDITTERTLRFGIDHDAHFQPVRATWAWDHTKDLPGPGDYTVRIAATNWQHTGTVMRDLPFTYDPQGEVVFTDDAPAAPEVEKAPAAGLVAALAALGVVAWAVAGRRPRRGP